MPELHYREALKLGQKEYRACVSQGEYPYLPALDDIVPPERSARGIELGLLSVPAEFVVGTRTSARTNAFARNFMPLLADHSEFAVKWERLCQSHLEEGIRDPVKVYEYLNRFYVEEGNKRVSVLKYFGAVQIAAQVIRVMPEESDAPEVQRYLEFVRFNRASGIGFLEFSGKGDYARFLEKAGKTPDEPWTEEERRRLSSAYYTFRRAFDAVCGTRLRVSHGDAFLSWLELHDYNRIQAYSLEELKKSVSDMQEELRLLEETPAIELKTGPEEKKRGFAVRLPGTVKPVKMAFFYDRNPEVSEWAYGHEAGRLHVQEAFEGRAETKAYGDLMQGDAEAAMEKAVEEGSTVLFATSPRLQRAALRTAVSHPQATVFVCSLNQAHRYIRTYYPRIHEAKFILGAIAGAVAEREEIGYICDYPIYGQIAGINAFALGVQTVNPRGRVILEWSDLAQHGRALERLSERGIRLVSTQSLTRAGSAENGLVQMKEDGSRLLAAPVWRWDVYYEAIIRRILDGSLQSDYADSAKALNYYWGMDAGVVDAAWSGDLPDGTKRLAEYLKQAISAGVLNPFATPVVRQDGKRTGEGKPSLGPEDIAAMDYLVEGVEGTIPEYRDLGDAGRATVDVMGVKREE